MLSGDNGILQKATTAKENTNSSQIQERISLAYHSALTAGLGKLKEETLETELKKEFNMTDLGTKWLDKTSVTGKWRITIDGVSIDLPVGQEVVSQVDPAKKYGYAENEGVVEANTLIPGDVINYYYDVDENPIECVVMYNDENHGLQVVSLDSIRNVKLGCSINDESDCDPKVLEAFSEEIPDGYGLEWSQGDSVKNRTFIKARWSYNYAIQTLNGYAQEYLGDMATNARCVGTPADNIILIENETTNMYIANGKYYSGHVRSGDLNVQNDNFEIVNEDLLIMDSLNIIKTPTSQEYWLASRTFYDGISRGTSTSEAYLYKIEDIGRLSTAYIFRLHDVSPQYNNYSYGVSELGYRPIFTIKSNIKVEKIESAENFNGPGGFYISDK